MIENERRVSPLSLFFEARHELRKHDDLEDALIERICELPEDDFCHNARESMSLGAGYAYLQLDQDGAEDQWTHVFTAFLALQPRSRYADELTVRRNNEKIIKAALDWLDSDEMPEIDPAVNQYVVEGMVAFINGFALTREYFEAQRSISSLPIAESA